VINLLTRIIVLALILASAARGSNAQKLLASVPCAPVSQITCTDPTGAKSSGFQITSSCSEAFRYQYRAHHKQENKSYVLSDAVQSGKTVKHCGITANADHEFLHFITSEPELSFAKDPTRLDDIRKIIAQNADPSKPNSGVSKSLVERTLALSKVPDSLSQEDFTTNAHRAWTELKDLRDKFPQNIPLRNAEYYTMGYYAGLSHDPYLSFGIDFGDGYMVLKWAARLSSFTEPWVRSDPNVASTPPGGTDWAQNGLRDGRTLRDTWTSTSDAKLRKPSYPITPPQ
jgi:hypothetical protein